MVAPSFLVLLTGPRGTTSNEGGRVLPTSTSAEVFYAIKSCAQVTCLLHRNSIDAFSNIIPFLQLASTEKHCKSTRFRLKEV